MKLSALEPTRLRVRLVGTFAITDPMGRDLTPRGAKARALVAMLVLEPTRRRSRRWIESHLWSDRAPEQASGSLRQAVLELRRSLGSEASCLRATREEVGLEATSTDIDVDPAAVAEALEAGRDLLEGLDVRDQAFEDWLRQERASLADRIGRRCPGEGPSLALPARLVLGELPGDLGGFVRLALANSIAQMISQFALVEVQAESTVPAAVDLPERGLTFCIDVAERGSALHAMASVVLWRTHTVAWSRAVTLDADDADLIRGGECPTLVFEAVDAALTALGRGGGSDDPAERANRLVSRAIEQAFRFDGAALRQADRLFAEAEAIWPSGVICAWRAFVRQTMLIERTEPDEDRLLVEADDFAQRAVEAEGANPFVLGLSSTAQVMLDLDPVTGTMLARDAVRLDPQNPFAQAALYGAHLRAGRPLEAWTAARIAVRIAARSRYVCWLETLAGIAAVAAGEFEAAIGHFEASHARAPLFRPPMRHLIFLYLASGQPDRAGTMEARLTRAEPDFSMGRILSDPDYPVTTLRRTRLLAAYPGAK